MIELPPFASRSAVKQAFEDCKAIRVFKPIWTKKHRLYWFDFNQAVPPAQPWRTQCNEATSKSMAEPRILASADVLQVCDWLVIFCGGGDVGQQNKDFVHETMKSTVASRTLFTTHLMFGPQGTQFPEGAFTRFCDRTELGACSVLCRFKPCTLEEEGQKQ